MKNYHVLTKYLVPLTQPHPNILLITISNPDLIISLLSHDYCKVVSFIVSCSYINSNSRLTIVLNTDLQKQRRYDYLVYFTHFLIKRPLVQLLLL